MKELPLIAFSLGDPCGVGPEIIVKSFMDHDIQKLANFVVCGPVSVLEKAKKSVGGDCSLQKLTQMDILKARPINEKTLWVMDFKVGDLHEITPGIISRAGGIIAGKALENAVELVRSNAAAALVTAPISKESFNLAGFRFPGHTEFLADRLSAKDVVMVLMSEHLRVGLATTHCALADVSHLINTEMLLNKLVTVSRDLKKRLLRKNPKIAVLGLNPHAGENGLFGMEEIDVIRPAIDAANKKGLNVWGPYPADTIFSTATPNAFDLYFAMYHDQGLIPLKMRSFGQAVNYTAGLPVVRTSPDHGTAFDIAGTGKADAGSMKEAIKVAVKMVTNT